MFWQLVFANAAIQTLVALDKQTKAIERQTAAGIRQTRINDACPHYAEQVANATGQHYCSACGALTI